jgi:hypothetical protein
MNYTKEKFIFEEKRNLYLIFRGREKASCKIGSIISKVKGMDSLMYQ